MEMTTKDTDKKPRFTLGSLVEVVGFSLGQGDVEINDIGTIIDITVPVAKEKRVFTVYIPRKKTNWICRDEDIKTVKLRSDISQTLTSAEKKEVLYDLVFINRKFKMVRDKELKDINDKIRNTEIELTRLLNERQKLNVMTSPPNELSTWDRLEDGASIVNYLFNRYYESIKIDGLGVIAITKPITLSYESHSIPLGQFLLEISMGRLLFYPYKDNVQVGSLIHPHIKGATLQHGSPGCLGTFAYDITKRLAEGDVLATLMKAGDFINHCASDGWYADVRHFLPDASKRCTRCWELGCTCTKQMCVHCGKEIGKECGCIVCPVTKEIIGKEYDVYCIERCEHWYKEEKRCRQNG
jgi:hypothetical protein